jgi:uncharacterized repeat protein (TIGR01451 family)
VAQQLAGRWEVRWRYSGFVNSMLSMLFPRWLWVVIGLAATAYPLVAQQHRATRLGDPAHRFAKPLQTPEDLRRLFSDPSLKADVVSILDQAGWKGDVEDLRRAAATAPIVAVKLPTGTRLPFMSSRNKGKPVTLIDVLWAGKNPIDAYEFEFVSKGWKYRCVTPKACANFLVVDLGPLKAVQVVRRVPPTASLCEPFDVIYEVRNTGGAALTQVQVAEVLPECLTAVEPGAGAALDVGTLQPGEVRSVRVRVQAMVAGDCVGRVKVTSAEGANAEAESRVTIQAPALEVSCRVPGEVLAGRPIDACVVVRNTGNAVEPLAMVAVAIPDGSVVGAIGEGGLVKEGAVVWEVTNLAPGAEKTFCVALRVGQPSEVTIRAGAKGQCAPPVETECLTKVAGIPAILLEVVDLEDPIEVGNQVTYEIRVTNQGSAVGTNLKWVCTLPASQEFVSGGGPTEVQGEGLTASAAALAALEPKAQVVWRVVVKAISAADARFKVEMTSDQFQRPVEEWEATSQY